MLPAAAAALSLTPSARAQASRAGAGRVRRGRRRKAVIGTLATRVSLSGSCFAQRLQGSLTEVTDTDVTPCVTERVGDTHNRTLTGHTAEPETEPLLLAEPYILDTTLKPQQFRLCLVLLILSCTDRVRRALLNSIPSDRHCAHWALMRRPCACGSVCGVQLKRPYPASAYLVSV